MITVPGLNATVTHSCVDTFTGAAGWRAETEGAGRGGGFEVQAANDSVVIEMAAMLSVMVRIFTWGSSGKVWWVLSGR